MNNKIKLSDKKLYSGLLAGYAEYLNVNVWYFRIVCLGTALIFGVLVLIVGFIIYNRQLNKIMNHNSEPVQYVDPFGE